MKTNDLSHLQRSLLLSELTQGSAAVASYCPNSILQSAPDKLGILM